MTAVPFSDAHFHSIATLRDEHAATFHSSAPPQPLPHSLRPCDTRRESATILHSRLSVSYCLLFFISSSSCRSLSGFSHVRLCLCLSICVFICLTRTPTERDAIVVNVLVIKAMRGNHTPPSPPHYSLSLYSTTLKSILDNTRHAAYAGLFWVVNTMESFVGKSHRQQRILRNNKSTRGASKILRLTDPASLKT